MSILCFALWAHEALASPPLTIQQQREDLAQLRRELEAIHPGLHLYADPAALDAAFARADGELVEGATVLGFLRSAMLPVAAVGCGHTVVEPKGLLERELYEAGGWFPLDLWVDGDRLWLDPRTVSGPPRELLEVEGLSTDRLVAELRARIESDGRAPAGQDVWIDEEPWFGVTVAMGPRQTWQVTTRVPGGEPVAESFAGVDPRQVRTGQAVWHRLNMVGPRVLYFPLPSLPDSKRDSRKKVKLLRELLEGADGLVLDLRGNGGGRTLSLMDLVAVFAPAPFDPYWEGISKVEWEDWPAGADGLHRAGPDTPGLYGGVQPTGGGPGVAGRVVRLAVLVDKGTGSSASDLAFLLRREAGATVVGSETSGGAWAQTAERTVYRVLTHSRLVVEIPMVTIKMGPDDLAGHGVVPDVAVVPTVQQLATGEDPAYACAVAVVRGLPCAGAPSGELASAEPASVAPVSEDPEGAIEAPPGP